MLKTREDASLTAEKASGIKLSNASPSARRSRNSCVLAFKASSVNFSYSEARALTFLTNFFFFFTSLSLRLPTTTLTSLPSMVFFPVLI